MTVLALYFKYEAQNASKEATARRLAGDSVAMLSSFRPGGDLNAMRVALAGYRIAPHVEILSSLQTVFNASARLIHASEGPEGIRSVAYSADGLRIVSGGEHGTLRLWDARNGEPIGQPLKGHAGAVSSVAYSADGLRIVSGGDDGTLRLWDAKSGEPMGQPLKGHAGAVWSVAYSADGLRIVSGGSDGTLRLWDARSGEPIGQPLKGHAGPVLSVAYSADGLRIVSGGEDGTLRQWDAPDAWPALLCAKLTRNFSKKEWRQYVGPEFDYRKQCPELPIPPD